MSDSERGERQPSEPPDDKPEALRVKVTNARDEAARARIDLLGADDPLAVASDDMKSIPKLCHAWYRAAATLYAAAANAYAQGNIEIGLMYEMSAASHLALGEACTLATER